VYFCRPYTHRFSGPLPDAKSWTPYLNHLLRLLSDISVDRIARIALISLADSEINSPTLAAALRRLTHTTTIHITTDVAGNLITYLLAPDAPDAPSPAHVSSLSAAAAPPSLFSPPGQPFPALETLEVQLTLPSDGAAAAAAIKAWWHALNRVLGQRRRAAPLARLVLLPQPRAGVGHLQSGMLAVEAHRRGIARARMLGAGGCGRERLGWGLLSIGCACCACAC
jgi:hypothetical protein